MTAQHAFVFDARFCTGCKACQAACKDRNNLPAGVLWRRVYEVSGGGWEQAGNAWENTVFAYHLSLACNHCAYPKCAGVCPVDAYTVRQDGIVLLDPSECIGCGYCAWACPYGAPQLDPLTRSMSKCNLCYDNIDAGLPPACAAACPMRALEYREVEGKENPLPGVLALWDTPAERHPFPLADSSRTEPRLAIRLHPAMYHSAEKRVRNLEEVRPQRRTGWEDAPLIAFTLLAQMAAGGLWWMTWLLTPLWLLVEHQASFLRLLPVLLTGSFLAVGMSASLAHLGTQGRVWRAVTHLRKSWLSREILMGLLFGGGWLLAAGAAALGQYHPAWNWPALVLGLGMVLSMAQVYRLRAVPAWNTWRTNAGFLVSALLLGELLMAVVLAFESHLTGINVFPMIWMLIGAAAVVLLALRAVISHPLASRVKGTRLWRGLLIAAAAAVIAAALLPGTTAALLAFIIVLAEETVSRWQFYEVRLA